MTTGDYHFDEGYREEAELGDGRRVFLRVVRPEDRALLVRGFERLSPESRYLRFMGTKVTLSEAELEALLDLDGEQRFAIGALRTTPGGGDGQGVGIARFARLPDEPDVAEAAVTVADEVQGRGLGSLLLRRLAAAARERGVRRFRGEVLLRNEPMRRLLEAHAEATVVDTGAETLRVLVELPSFDRLMRHGSGRSDALEWLLAQAAGGGLTMRLSEVLLKRR